MGYTLSVWWHHGEGRVRLTYPADAVGEEESAAVEAEKGEGPKGRDHNKIENEGGHCDVVVGRGTWMVVVCLEGLSSKGSLSNISKCNKVTCFNFTVPLTLTSMYRRVQSRSIKHHHIPLQYLHSTTTTHLLGI